MRAEVPNKLRNCHVGFINNQTSHWMYEAELGLNPTVHSPHGAAAGNIQLGA